MEKKDFISKLKADALANHLNELYSDYKALLEKVPSEDKGPFSLKVLLILCSFCRNIDKVPSWRENIDGKALLHLSIDCVQQTTGLDKPERIKVLWCV